MYTDTYLVGVVDQLLPTYIIKEGTRFISSKAFKNCKKLTSFTIPNSVIRVGENTFDDCYNLEKVTCLATEVPKIILSNSAVAYMNGLYFMYQQNQSRTIGSQVLGVISNTSHRLGHRLRM